MLIENITEMVDHRHMITPSLKQSITITTLKNVSCFENYSIFTADRHFPLQNYVITKALLLFVVEAIKLCSKYIYFGITCPIEILICQNQQKSI